MPWFKVDDGLHAHRKAARAGVDAMGLWVLAGSWSADQLTDGFIPDYIAMKLDPKARAKASRLVAAGFWFETERDGDRGWQFHDWDVHQPAAKVTLAKRAEAKDRMQRLREERRANRNGNRSNGSQDVRANSSRTFADGSSEVRSAPTRPDPSRPELPTEVLKPAGVDLGSSLTRQDPSEVESEQPAPKPRGIYALPKAWCTEHGCPDDKDCTGCLQDYGDVAHFAKLRLSGSAG